MAELTPQLPLARQLLATAVAQGASDAQVLITQHQGLTIDVLDQQVEQLDHCQGQSLTLTFYQGHRSGTVTTTDLTPGSHEALIQQAKTMASVLDEDPADTLPDPTLLATSAVDCDSFHLWPPSTSDLINLGKDCERQLLASDARIAQSDSVVIQTHQAVETAAHTQGFEQSRQMSRYSIQATAVAQGPAGLQRDYDYTVAVCPDDLDPVSLLAKRTAERSLARLNIQKIKPQKTPVILAPLVARSFWSYALSAMSGRAQYRKNSFWLDAQGQTVLPNWLSVYDRPHLKRGLGSTGYDQDGVATRDQCLINGGQLEQYLLSQYSANRLGLTSNGFAGGVHNVQFEVSDPQRFLSHQALLQHMDTGLYVTEVMGSGVDPTTGDFSLGIFGYWVEQGVIQHAVEGMTLAGNLKTLFMDLVALGDDADCRGRIQAADLLVESLQVA